MIDTLFRWPSDAPMWVLNGIAPMMYVAVWGVLTFVVYKVLLFP